MESWGWQEISRYINIEEVRKDPNRTWDKSHLSLNLGITLRDIDTRILPNAIDDWDWYGISMSIDINEI